MKTRPEIVYEVFQILNQDGFEVWWYVGHYFALRHGRQWWPDHPRACNRIIK